MRIAVEGYGLRKLAREVNLPDKGLVLVTAPNESGKTSLFADAPMIALFGRTDPNRGDPLEGVGRIELTFGDFHVERIRRKSGKTARVLLSGKPIDCDGITKTNEFIERRFGTAEVWERLANFRFQDADDFTLGTDSERKRFVEVLLPQLAGFEPGLEACKTLLKENARPLSEAMVQRAQVESRIAHHQETIDQLRAITPEVEDLADLQKQIVQVDKRRAAIEARQQLINKELHALSCFRAVRYEASAAEVSRGEGALQAHRKLAEAAATGQCGACGAVLSDERRAAYPAEGDALIRGLEALRSKARIVYQEELGPVRAKQDELTQERDLLATRLREVYAESAQLRDRLTRFESYAKTGLLLTSEQTNLESAVAEWKEICARHEALKQNQLVLELVERALGPKGAKPLILDHAFKRLEVVANGVLATIWPGAKVTVERTSVSQAGKVREESRVLVTHPHEGTTHPTAAYNRGMLRRVDLAFRLARRRLYAEQLGKARLPLPWFVIDEALDGIDERGLSGCAQVLKEEARNGVVVILTHDEKVRRGVPYDERIELK